MTPEARISTAIELLDRILDGDPAERVLTRWARASRFAGSKDRAAVRDIVFDVLRRKRSLAWPRPQTGRNLALAHTRAAGLPMEDVFTGQGYAPAVLTDEERVFTPPDLGTAPLAVQLDVPDALLEELQTSLGYDLRPVLNILRTRAPVDLRVNLRKTGVKGAITALMADDITVEPVPLSPTALRVLSNPRRVQGSRAYREGLVELQDASSQAVADFTGVKPGMTVLDYCAGGGGKTLAMGALMQGQGRLLAHDVNPGRMRDIPARAARAGLSIDLVDTRALPGLAGQCDLVLVDAPCSGTGAWRRNPDAKWRFTLEDLERLHQIQADILTRAIQFVKPGGCLIYATCSLLRSENEAQTTAFVETGDRVELISQKRLSPLDGGDGFYLAEIALR